MSSRSAPRRICIVGKYPPIEGGVSTTTYWLAHLLAQRGHHIHVVTNAEEVEARYRMTLEPADAPMLQPRFPDTGGRVDVHHVAPFSPWAMSHIPTSNPYLTRLASLATDVVRRENCDVILGFYFEPYGMAAWLAARWTGRPVLLKHAGSDLDRLGEQPDFAVAYREILTDAEAVITQPALTDRFLTMGVAPERVVCDPPRALPPQFFRPDGARLDTGSVALGGFGTFRADAVTIGVYGKVNASKGTFDLVAALGVLAREGHDFNLVALVGAEQGELLRAHAAEAGIADQLTVLPYLPNWRVPDFIRACTAVCFLERGFPVAIHGPLIAAEVLCCGTCLVVSGEIHAKQRQRDELRHGQTCVVVDDPREIPTLAAALRELVTDPGHANDIGLAGQRLTAPLLDIETYLDRWEDVLAGDGPTTRSALAAVDRDSDIDIDDSPQYRAARTDVTARHPDELPPFAVVDQLGGRRVLPDVAGALHPVRTNHLRVVDTDGPDGPMTIAVARTAGSSMRELGLGRASLALLDACDGSRECADVVAAVLAEVGANPDDEGDRAAAYAALDEFYRLGVIAFGAPDPVWGWRHGLRSDLTALPSVLSDRAVGLSRP